MRQLIVFVVVFTVFSCASKTQTVQLDRRSVAEENNSHGFCTPYQLSENTAITRLGEYEVTFPANFKAHDTAFAREYFTGHSGKLENGIGLLIANRKTGWPLVYADYNNNLDFSDDRGPMEFSKQDSSLILTFKRKDNPTATFPVKYTLPELSKEKVEQYEKFFNRDGHVKSGIPMLSARYWLFTQRLNSHMAHTTMGGDSAKLALCDYNCNGYYNDIGEDRIFVAPPHIEYSSNKPSGAFTLKNDSTLFAFEDQVYEITNVDSLGRSISIKKSDLPFDPPIAPGHKLPDYEFQLLSGKDTNLSAFTGGEKYLLIDAWGSWCKGCHSSAPDLRELSEKYGDRLHIVGLNTGEPKEKIEAFNEKYDHHWTQGMLNSKIMNDLLIDSYPTYILVDPQGKIVSLKTYPFKVEKILAEGKLRE